MKKILLFIFGMFAVSAFCQTKNDCQNLRDVTIRETNVYGYLNGVRLDSLNSKYATLDMNYRGLLGFTNGYLLSFGQPAKTKFLGQMDNITGTDCRLYHFDNVATALNFMDFNGWELLQTVHGNNELMIGFILRKKQL